MSRSKEDSILEILEPLVYEDQKVWAIMGSKNMFECQAVLYAWRNWLDRHYHEKANWDVDHHPGKFSVWYNKFSKDVILYYALKGYKHFAATQHEDAEKIMKMSIRAHAIIMGASYAKPKVVPLDPKRINIKVVGAFQVADALFSNPEPFLKRDTDGEINWDKSGWTANEGQFNSPLFRWQVLTAYEANLFAHEYFLKAKKLKENGGKNNVRNAEQRHNQRRKTYFEERHSQRLEDIILTYT